MPASVTVPLRALVVLCLASAAWAFAFGVGTQAATLQLQHAGLDSDAIGLNAGTYYLGMALTGLVVPALMRRLGPACVAAGMALFGAAVALFPWTDSPTAWLALRLLQGVGGALSLVPLEAYVHQVSPAEHTGRNFSFYAVALTLAGAVGLTVGLHVYRPGSALPFALAGASALGGGLLVALALPRLPADAGRLGGGAAPPPATVPTARQRFLGYGTAWVQGFLEGGLLTFLPLYLLTLGLAQESVGTLVGAALVGVILFQVPVGWLADRLGKVPVLLLCYAVVALGLLLVPRCGPGPWLGLWLFLVGGCAAALFPVGLALLGEGLTGGRLARAYAGYMTMDCLGSVAGPVCMGQAQRWAGGPGLFAAGEAALALVLLSWLGLRLCRYNAREDRGQRTEDRRQAPARPDGQEASAA
jgi:MFS family permease